MLGSRVKGHTRQIEKQWLLFQVRTRTQKGRQVGQMRRISRAETARGWQSGGGPPVSCPLRLQTYDPWEGLGTAGTADTSPRSGL